MSRNNKIARKSGKLATRPVIEALNPRLLMSATPSNLAETPAVTGHSESTAVTVQLKHGIEQAGRRHDGLTGRSAPKANLSSANLADSAATTATAAKPTLTAQNTVKGTISGTVYLTPYGNPLAQDIVYIDVAHVGYFRYSDPFVHTNFYGKYEFTNVPAGNYTVGVYQGQYLWGGRLYSARPQVHVSVTASHPNIAGINFALGIVYGY